jgi:glycosyltransferase involved in cell wall biosynthesis
MMRLAYLVTHPIQYQAPLLRRIAAEPGIQLTVFFASDISTRRFVDKGFSRPIAWDTNLFEGYDYEFLPTLGSADRISMVRPFNIGVTRRLRLGNFSALWVHGYMRPYHWAAMAAARRLGMKVLIRDEATLVGRNRGPVTRALKPIFFRWLSRMTNAFLAIGSLNRDYYHANGIEPDRVFWMPYAVDNDFFQAKALAAAPQRQHLRAQLGLEPGRPVILFVGKLVLRKRPGDLLDAWARLAADCGQESSPYLIYVGDGELRRELEARTVALGLDSVHFLGFKNQSELPAFYELCDIFVMPTVFEPWGLVLNEVMNAGKPIIASDQVGCVPDLVRDGYNGFVYPAGDVGALHDALRLALADRGRLAAMGQRSLEIINRWSFELEIINRWSFEEDVLGLRAALGLNT